MNENQSDSCTPANAADCDIESSSTVYAAKLAATVVDPELPFITVAELGVLRDVREDHGTVVVTVAPTYSGCPAVETIEQRIERKLQRAGFRVRVERQLSPPWTTAWITEAGRQKLRENGVVPPLLDESSSSVLFAQPAIDCPNCGSGNTQRVSEFGSTACKAQYRCNRCLEPFEYFKCL